MRTPPTVRERLRIARGRLREYEGSLRRLEGRLTTLRGQAEQVRGRARLRLLRMERQIRATLDATLETVDRTTKTLEPRVQRALDQANALRRGIEAGIKEGTKTYRRARPK